MIKRIISGGQTGVDIAALEAALELGISTSGAMPFGWRTLDGPRPEYEKRFGMKQTAGSSYAPRTFANAGAAGLTLRIAADWNTQGELCTLRAVAAVGQEPFDIGLDADLRVNPLRLAAALARIRAAGPGLTLNVAGNSEQSAPGIERVAKRILRSIFRRCLETT